MAVAGVSYRQDVVADCWEGDEVRLIRDPANKYDKNAIKVHSSMGHIGFIWTYPDFVDTRKRVITFNRARCVNEKEPKEIYERI